MAKRNILLRTNALVCIIIIAGFLVTAVLSYRANYSSSVVNIEQVSDLTSEGIFYQLSSVFTKPVNVSLTMANDSLLREFLSDETDHLDDPAYIQTLAEYLDGYQKKYDYDSVFLVSTATGRYYNFNGLDRVLTPDNPENDWYYNTLSIEEDYFLNVDNDEVVGADNEITVFVDCKIEAEDGSVLGVVGVGMRVDYLQLLLQQYKDEFDVDASLVDADGVIQLSTDYTGYERVNLFDNGKLKPAKDQILGWNEEGAAQKFWLTGDNKADKEDYVVTRFIPELDWHLVVQRDTEQLIHTLRTQLYQTMAVIFALVVLILLVITYVIRGFTRQIIRLSAEKEDTFRRVTEELYDNIYELNITKNRAAGKSTERYFESLGVPPNTPFDQALPVVAEKQIKEEFREGYVTTFSPENVLQEYRNGNTAIEYDFMMSEDGKHYFWMRIDAHIYYSSDDNCIHMFTYRKNIDQEKRQELKMAEKVSRDEMTQLFNRTATQQNIQRLLLGKPDQMYGFFILDIDNFKQVNDHHGHAFGDLVIIEFARRIRQQFGSGGVLGRIGGDEYVAFVPLSGTEEAERHAQELTARLNRAFTAESLSWELSASIGIALAPTDGKDFETLYRMADTALYQAKNAGKGSYAFYRK